MNNYCNSCNCGPIVIPPLNLGNNSNCCMVNTSSTSTTNDSNNNDNTSNALNNVHQNTNQIDPSILRYCTGFLDAHSNLAFDTYHIANSGENLATQIVIQIPATLSTFSVYFEFLLPNKERFLSEPITPRFEIMNLYNNNTLVMEDQQVLIVRYNLPRYVCAYPGTVSMNLKCVNSSNMVLKSKPVQFQVSNTVNATDSDRYFSGDLLDYLATHMVKDVTYDNGILTFYQYNPSLGVNIPLKSFDIRDAVGNHPAQDLTEEDVINLKNLINNPETSPADALTQEEVDALRALLANNSENNPSEGSEDTTTTETN